MFALAFPAIDPVAVEIGPLAIRWYALAYVLGLLLGSGSALLATLHAREGAPFLSTQNILTFLAPLLVGLIAIVLGVLPAMTGRLTDRLRND